MRHYEDGKKSCGDGTSLGKIVDPVRDRHLVERCQAGDAAAFGALYDHYRRRLFRFCLRHLQEPNDAEEAVQEAFVKAWCALPRLEGERRFYPWLTVIARNVCTDMIRRRARLVPIADVSPDVMDPEAEIDATLLRQVDIATVSETLAHLSPRHQRVLRLREGWGWSSQRIAEEEGLAPTAVDPLVWRARQAFKREFAAMADVAAQLGAVPGLAALAMRRLRVWCATRRGGRVVHRLSQLTLSSLRHPAVLAVSVVIGGATFASGVIALVPRGDSHVSGRVGVRPVAIPKEASQGSSASLRARGSPSASSPASSSVAAGSTVGTSVSTGTVGGLSSVTPKPFSIPLRVDTANSTTGALTTTLKGTTGALTTTLKGTTGALTTTQKGTTGALTTTLKGTTGALTTTLKGTTGALTTTTLSSGQPTLLGLP